MCWQDGKRFFDITDNADLGTLRAASKSVFPKKIAHQKEVNPLLEQLSKKEMEDHLTKFTSFHTRYYKVRPNWLSQQWDNS
jgi:bacterial leucyl aminopeptidase